MSAGGATFAGTGAVAVGTGISITGNAINKINGASHNVQYSFATSAEDRAKAISEKATYSPSNKHVGVKSYGSKMNLSDEEAQNVLDDATQSGGQKYDFKDGKIYEFQCDDAGTDLTWHGYEIPAKEMQENKAISVLKEWLNEGKITKSEYGKLVKGKSIR